MQSRHISMNLLKIRSIFCLLALTAQCSSNKSKKRSDVNIEDFLTDDEIFDDIDKAKKIFYSLPSPLETAMLIKSAGAEYDDLH